jgi:hypothetical protein|eukprot:COSAG02_NODE_4850_length_4905_cov_6.344985_2_plen_89_part_00
MPGVSNTEVLLLLSLLLLSIGLSLVLFELPAVQPHYPAAQWQAARHSPRYLASVLLRPREVKARMSAGEVRLERYKLSFCGQSPAPPR